MLFTDQQQRFNNLTLSESVQIASKNAGGIIDVAPGTIKWFRNAINSIETIIGNARIDELTPEDIYQWHQFKVNEIAAISANSYLRAIKTLYSRLLKMGYVAQNPAHHVPYAPEPPNNPKAIKPDTYLKIRAAANTIRNKMIIALLWETGCRVSELTTIDLKNLEIWENKLAARVLGKGGKYRFAYAAGFAAESMKQYIETERPLSARTTQLITTHTGQPITTSAIVSAIAKIRKRANIPKYEISNPHSFRHAFAIRKLNEGYDLAIVSQWLGHADPAFTAATYCIRREDELRDIFFTAPKQKTP